MKLTPDRKAWKHWRRAVRRRIKASPDLRRERRLARPRVTKHYSWTSLRVLVPLALAITVLNDGPVTALAKALVLWTTLITFVRAQQIAANTHDPNQLWIWYGWPVTDDSVFAHQRGYVLRAAVWLVVDWLVFGLAVAWKTEAVLLAFAAPVIALAQGVTALAIAVWLARWRPQFPFAWVTTPLTVLVFFSVKLESDPTRVTAWLDLVRNALHTGTPAGWLLSGWHNIVQGHATGWGVLLGIGVIAFAALVAGARAMRKVFNPDALFDYQDTPEETGDNQLPASAASSTHPSHQSPESPSPQPTHRETAPVDLSLLRMRTEGVLATPPGRALAARGTIEQAVTWFLTQRQRTLVDFMVPRGMPWNRRWLIALALLGIVVIVGGTSSPDLRILPAIAALAFALPVLGGRWLGFEAMRTFQTQIGLTSYVPTGFWETSRLVLTINALYCLIAFPFVLAVVWLGFAPAHAPFTWSLDYSLRGIGIVLAFQPVWLVSKFSTNTNDSSTGRLWFAGLVVLIIAGLIIGVSLCVVAVMIDSTPVALGCVGALALLTHAGLALYGWVWGRGWFDLIAKLK